MISSRHSEDPAKHPHLRGSSFPLVGNSVTFIAQHSLPYIRAGLIMAPYTFALNLRGIFRSYNTPANFLQPCSLQAKVHVSVDGSSFIYHRSQVLEMVNILQFFSIQFDWQRVFPCWQMFCFPTLIFRPRSVKTFCHDSSLFWVSVLVM